MKQAFVNLLGIVIVTAGLYASVIMATSPPEVSEPTGDLAWKEALTPIEHFVLTGMENIEPMSESQVGRIVEHAIGCESAVIFWHVNWHCSSHIDREKFPKLVASYHKKYPDQKIGFHYIDATEGTAGFPPHFVDAMSGGNFLLWLHNGKIVKSSWFNDSVDNMVEITRDLTMPNTTKH